jgi:hypothetical protein
MSGNLFTISKYQGAFLAKLGIIDLIPAVSKSTNKGNVNFNIRYDRTIIIGAVILVFRSIF